MNAVLEKHPHVLLRPHIKAHKSAYFTSMQATAGVQAWCCQKLFEAERILASVPEVKDMLITNEIVGQRKIQRLIQLVKEHGKTTTVTVLVDDKNNCKALDDAVAAANVPPLRVLAEVDVGQQRCGVAPASDELVD